MAVRATEENFNTEVLETEGIVIVDFYSDSCVPCKRMSPILAELEEENPDVKLIKVNINFDKALAEKYEVQAAPTLVYFKDGQEYDRTTGAVNKAAIEKIIDKIG